MNEQPDYKPNELRPEALCRQCDPASFSFVTTDELPYAPEIIGQDRAAEAIHFGLDIQSPGFNVFVMGPSGTGRRSTLQRIVHDQAQRAETPDDWVYVYHFADPHAPRAISLPPGRGREFRFDMDRFSSSVLERLQRAFEADPYVEAREKLAHVFREAQQTALASVDAACREGGYALVRSASGLYISPVRAGELLTPEAFSQLPEDERTGIERELDALNAQLDAAMRQVRDHERVTQMNVETLDRDVASSTVEPLLRELRDKYAERDEVQTYFDEVLQDIVANVDLVRSSAEGEAEGESRSALDVPFGLRYRVNLLVDNGSTDGAPVIVEDVPTYDKLFGRIEYDVRAGATVTDHTLIRPGALHRANGGYLILDAETLLDEPHVWAGLKRALFDGEVRIESPDGQQLVRSVTPAPEPVPLRVKIILRGERYTYYALYGYDTDFAKLFKVLADFSSEMERTVASERMYAQFVRTLGQDEGLLPFTPDAIARVVQFGSRLAEHQDRLSTNFGRVADLAREAAYWTKVADQPAVRREDVLKALRQKQRRAGQRQERLQRAIREGRLVIATSGACVGQINGLTVMSAGDYAYGLPSRITARAYVGRGNVFDIHREIHLSGPIHSKGLLTLIGYFSGQYGTKRSLSMEASLSFEQVYDDIDGDSASCAELYALIAAIAEIPLRQDVAVTGAVDQYGSVLPIGGANVKIEGFFDICRQAGLTGTQGVVIPKLNVSDLMLHEEVVEAVRAGLFHIYAVETVDEGLALLTGRPAGLRDADGNFPEDSVHASVAARLEAFAESGRDDKPEEEDDGKTG